MAATGKGWCSGSRLTDRGRIFAVVLPIAAIIAACAAQPSSAGWTTLPNAPVAPGGPERFDDVCFASPDSGWIVDGSGEIHRTTDGGQSWTLQAQLHTYLRSVGFANRMKGWAGNLLGSPLLYATSNAGATWTPVTNIPNPQPDGICGLWVVDDSVAYGCGRFDGPPAVVIKTTDGGATWTSRDMEPQAASLIDCFFFDRNHGFVVGGTGPFESRHAVVLSTDDGGATWQTRHTTNRPGAEWCWKISFPTRTVGYVAIEREDHQAFSYLLKTTNGGQSWSELPFVGTYDEEGIGFVTPDFGWVGGWSGPTYETYNGGASWHLAGFGFYVNRFRFLSPMLGYAVGQTVYKYTVLATDVASSPVPTQAVMLAPSRPNPIIESTRIPFRLGAEAHVRVTIHDLQGRAVRTLLDGVRPAGPSELSWDTRDANGNPVGAGVYWCRIETAAGSAATKLLVVR